MYHYCTKVIFGDKGYVSARVQLDLFETANIRLECPYKLNQKDCHQQNISHECQRCLHQYCIAKTVPAQISE